MKDPIDSLRSGMVAQLGDIERDLAVAVERVTAHRISRRKIIKALKALNEVEGEKSAPKQAQVEHAIERLLIENGGSVAAEDLEGLAAEKLAKDFGCSAVGLTLRIGELMAADKFAIIEGEIMRSTGNAASPVNRR